MIRVKHYLASTGFKINQALSMLSNYPIMSFDTETKGLYSKEERAEAKEFLKKDNIPISEKQLAMVVANNSGLNFPSLVEVTHFVFGLSEDFSVILISNSPQTEMMIWNWISRYKGKLLIHNTLYDLKIMYHRLGLLPHDYEDTQLLAKTHINHADAWKARTGLKDLMAEDYDPSWTLIEEYEPDDPKDPKFIRYAAIDGAATFKLWCDIHETTFGDWEPPVNPPFPLGSN